MLAGIAFGLLILIGVCLCGNIPAERQRDD
jgi:hypothetical protein